MARGTYCTFYVRNDKEEIVDKIDRVKPDDTPRAKVIIEALEMWLEENGEHQDG